MQTYLAVLEAAGTGFKMVAPYAGYVGMATFGIMTVMILRVSGRN